MMQSLAQRRWKGRWIMVVAVLHLVVGLAMASQFFAQMVGEGWFNTANGLGQSLTIWFLAFAPTLFLIGLFTDRFEKNKEQLPIVVPIVMSALLIFLLSAQPVSGGWLLVPPTLAMFASRKSNEHLR